MVVRGPVKLVPATAVIRVLAQVDDQRRKEWLGAPKTKAEDSQGCYTHPRA